MANFISIIFALGSIASLLLVEVFHNETWIVPFTFIGVVEAIALPISFYLWRRRIREQLHRHFVRTAFQILIGCCSVALLGAPYALLANAATATGQPINFTGPVLSKYLGNGKGGPIHIVKYIDRRSGREIELTTTSEEYQVTEIGSPMSRCMKIGGFGIPFRWRFSSAHPICSGS